MGSVDEVSFRLGSAEDVEAVVSLDRALETLPHWPSAEYRAAISGGDPQLRRCLFVAEAGGELLGLAVGRAGCIAGECEGELESVGVAASAQRRGLGRELCRLVVAWCAELGALHIDLEVRSQSAGAIGLYSGLGFVAVGRRRGYYREPVDDAVLMRLDLKQESSDTGLRGGSAP